MHGSVCEYSGFLLRPDEPCPNIRTYSHRDTINTKKREAGLWQARLTLAVC